MTMYRNVEPHPKRLEGGGHRPAGLPDPARPLVTVVTVTRNAARLLPDTLASVASQSYTNIEYVVIDGASTDGTLDILRSHEHAISRWVSEPDAGIYDAMNKGIAMARGALVKLLNADDLLPSDSVARAVAAYRTLARGTCIYGDLAVTNVGGQGYGRLTLGGGIRFFPIFLHPGWYVPLSVYETYGLYHTRYRVASDYEYSLRLRRAGVPFHHVGGDPVVTFRADGASSSYAGVREGFLINREYQGLGPATYVAGMHALLKFRRGLINGLLGERAALGLRTQVHEWRARRAKS